jgi:GT2 family glycosyltransferase
MTTAGALLPVRVSIVMANYNGARYLPDAIESVRGQTLREWELLICDDASVDGSASIAARYAAQDPRIHIIKNETNLGPAASRNRALAQAKGEWIAIADSDDIMHPARLRTLIAAAERDGAGLVADDLIVFYEDRSRHSHGFLPRDYAGKAFWVDAAAFVRSNTFYAGGAGLGYLKPLIRADLLSDAAARYDESLTIGEDYDFIFRLLLAGAKYRVIPRQLYYYRKHSASISHRLSSEAARAMLDASCRLHPLLAGAGADLHDAEKKRNKSLETVLLFNTLIAALKAHRAGEAAALLAGHPRLLPLLREPLRAWRARLWEKLAVFAVAGPAVHRKPAQ